MRKGSFVVAALIALLLTAIILTRLGQIVQMRSSGFHFPQREIWMEYAPSAGRGVP